MFKAVLALTLFVSCSSAPSNVKKENKYCYTWRDVPGFPHKECFNEKKVCEASESYLRDNRPWYKVIQSCDYY